tara:strand:- start:62 stop:541 length:480 start_codon:yes stop_codon:yes gene_type:complete
MNLNVNYSQKIIHELNLLVQCQLWCVCPGGRNSPFIMALKEMQSLSFYNEEVAAFFALGRVKRDSRPVAVSTTSGTAVAQLLPAVIEAYYTQLPLILVTADRPASYRDTGAPQSINQIGIFSQYAHCIDLDIHTPLSIQSWNQQIPLHLNICFDEPLLD